MLSIILCTTKTTMVKSTSVRYRVDDEGLREPASLLSRTPITWRADGWRLPGVSAATPGTGSAPAGSIHRTATSRARMHLDLWGVSLIDTDPAPLKAFMWMIEHVLGHPRRRRRSTPIVVYDEQSGVRAARAFWFLEYFGHPDVQAARRRVRRLDARRPTGPATPAAAHDRVDRRPRGRRSRRGARCTRASADPDTVILDTRSDGEYCGTTVRATRGGAIPGAVHIEWTRNLDARRRLQAGGRAARDVRAGRRDARP